MLLWHLNAVSGRSQLFIARGNMSLYADYLKERTEDKIIEGESGFVTYRYVNNNRSVYIVDIYTVPERRQKGTASYLADLVAEEAKALGCTEMLGTVAPSTKGSTRSMKVLLAYGFDLQSSVNDGIILRKDL